MDAEKLEERLTEYERALNAAGIVGREQGRRLRRYERQLLNRPPRWRSALMTLAVVAAIPAGFWLLSEVNARVWAPSGRGDSAVLVGLGFAVVAAGCGFAAYRTHRVSEPMGWMLRSLVATAVVLGVGVYMVDGERRTTSRLIGDYCSYGAVSEAQLAGCKSHVHYDDVIGRDTPAARFAKGDDVCGPDSGHFCERARNWRDLREQQQP